jgi:hypothetical protein
VRMRRMRQTQVHRDLIAEGIAAAGAGMIAPSGTKGILEEDSGGGQAIGPYGNVAELFKGI